MHALDFDRNEHIMYVIKCDVYSRTSGRCIGSVIVQIRTIMLKEMSNRVHWRKEKHTLTKQAQLILTLQILFP